ncbi:MAG TPA: hypothetical protein VFB19_15370 [Mycobacterium sp.]|nr:hypothetical protein [Mycobacterium sp.]
MIKNIAALIATAAGCAGPTTGESACSARGPDSGALTCSIDDIENGAKKLGVDLTARRRTDVRAANAAREGVAAAAPALSR